MVARFVHHFSPRLSTWSTSEATTGGWPVVGAFGYVAFVQVAVWCWSCCMPWVEPHSPLYVHKALGCSSCLTINTPCLVFEDAALWWLASCWPCSVWCLYVGPVPYAGSTEALRPLHALGRAPQPAYRSCDDCLPTIFRPFLRRCTTHAVAHPTHHATPQAMSSGHTHSSSLFVVSSWQLSCVCCN